jgi:hypothetical protein
MKRKLAEAETQLEIFEELYKAVRLRSEADAHEVVRRLRAGHEPDAILRHFKGGDLLRQMTVHPPTSFRYSFPGFPEMPSFLRCQSNPYLDSLLYVEVDDASSGSGREADGKPSGRLDQYRVPYHAAELVDARIDNAVLSRWTSVSRNDELLRELLRAYLLFEYPLYPFFHKDHFLDDMVAGRSRFCSSLLVNAILAAACVRHLGTDTSLLLYCDPNSAARPD